METKMIIALIVALYFLWVLGGLAKLKNMEEDKYKRKVIKKYQKEEAMFVAVLLLGPLV